jgi:hypothetical protein
MNIKRILAPVIGLVHRVAYATLFAGATWYACGYPNAFRSNPALQKAVCYGLDYPIAVIGRVTAPYRGIDVFFDRGGEWCDFCSAQQVLWYHVRFAVPVYVVLFYLPTLALWLVCRWRSRPGREHVVAIESTDEA